MQAETRTMTQLFQLDVRYVIPLYQRPYVWTEEQQWAPLWEDIVTVAEHFLAAGPTGDSPSHFLGAIVIQRQDTPPGTPPRFLVIDGQQRLTTLQILLGAAVRAADTLGCAAEAELLRRLVYNNELLAKDDELFKVWPTNANQHAFRLVMDPALDPAKASDDPGNEIQEAHAFFAREITAWVKDGGAGAEDTDQVAQHFAALRVALSELLKLVSIRLEEGDNPQVIFETLNARGTPLIALDLLKNTVFLAADHEGAETEKLYYKHWAPELDLEYWRSDRRQGRLFTKNGDLFLQYWLVAELAEPVPATELFKTFRERVLQRASCPAMTELIPQLARDAGFLRKLDDAPADTPEGRFYGLLDLLDTTTMMPLALLLLRSPDVTPERRANAFSVLESFLVRRMICGWTTKNYNRLAAGLVGELKKDLPHADEILRDRLAAETAPANMWPSDAAVRETVEGRPLYGQRRQDRLVMVLWEIEHWLRRRDKKVEPGLGKPPKLTLEHLIPQSWGEHWPLDEHQDEPEEWRNSHVHLLGNLTLTTGQLNSSISNGPWNAPEAKQDKSRSLPAHSLLKLNTTVVREYPEHFDEHSVDERGALFAQAICEIWPGPGEVPAPHATALGAAPEPEPAPTDYTEEEIELARRTEALLNKHGTEYTIGLDRVRAYVEIIKTTENFLAGLTPGQLQRIATGEDPVSGGLTERYEHTYAHLKQPWHWLKGIIAVAAAMGYEPPPAAADERDVADDEDATRKRRHYPESLADLIAAGLLSEGTILRPISPRYEGEAIVRRDGRLRVADEVVNAPSTAGQRITGRAEPGWEFWGAPDENGELVSLFELRERLRASGGVPPLPSGRPRGPGRAVYDVTLGQLIDAGVIADGETVVALRKRVDHVEATIHADGSVRANGNTYSSLSAAASAVSQVQEPGWEFWAVRRPEGLVSLYEIRRRYLAEHGG